MVRTKTKSVESRQSSQREQDKIKKSWTISDGKLLEKGAEYSNGQLFVAAEEVKKMYGEMEEGLRENRIKNYFTSIKSKIGNLNKVDDEISTTALEKRLEYDRDIIQDAVFQYDAWRLIPKEKGVEMAERMMKRDKIKNKFRKEVESRKAGQEEVEKIKWTPINFYDNVETFLAKKSYNRDEVDLIEGIKDISKALTTPRGYRGVSPEVEEVGPRVEKKIEEKHFNGLEILLGQKIPKARIESIRYSYLPNSEMDAVMITLKEDYSISPRKMRKEIDKRQIESGVIKLPEKEGASGEITNLKRYEEIEKEVKAESEVKKVISPYLSNGSLIIKSTGKKMFLPGGTWRPYITQNCKGRIVMTFDKGSCYDRIPSGIFDEDVFCSDTSIDTSRINYNDQMKFYDGTDNSNADDYDFMRCGSTTRRNGKTKFYWQRKNNIPKARVSYDKENNLVIYKLDTNLEKKI